MAIMTERVETLSQTEPNRITKPEWNAVEVHGDEIVEERYQGTTADRQDMRMLGRVQVLRVRRNARPLPKRRS